MPGIRLEGVARQFGAVRAVDAVSLDVAPGEFVTLLGPSGCGKTTTLRMVAGLERNDSGRILIGDRVVSDAASELFVPPDRRQLGMVFQSYAIWPHMTVFDNVAYPLKVRKAGRATIAAQVTAALRLVEMERYADRPAPALSGGQQQRVAIARALVFEPEVLLLDEPLSNLDARLRAQMGEEFRALQRRLGLTTLYVTHDQAEAMALSDRVVVMQAGRVLQAGPPAAVYQRPANQAVARFFGQPNLIGAEVAACRANGHDDWHLTLRGTGWHGACRAGERFEPGAAVLAVVRPEDIRLAAAGASPGEGEIAWPARLIEDSFRGSHRAMLAEAEGLRFRLEAPAASPARVGEAVTMLVAADSVWAVRPGES